MARKALSDLAGVSLEERMIEVFVARLAGASVAQGPARASWRWPALSPDPALRAQRPQNGRTAGGLLPQR